MKRRHAPRISSENYRLPLTSTYTLKMASTNPLNDVQATSAELGINILRPGEDTHKQARYLPD